MKAQIYCRVTAKGIHSFYYSTGDNNYFLFNQDYRVGVNEYFKNGVSLKEALDYPPYHRHNTALIRTKSKLPSYLKFIEKTEQIIILDKTARKKKSYFEYRTKKNKIKLSSLLEEGEF